MLTLFIEGGEAQEAFGARLAAHLPKSCILYLEGDLGAGKTTLVRGILRGLGYEGRVKSPTYTLIESYYPGDYAVHHLDLYRLADPEELEYMGFSDLCDGCSILLVEWPDKGVGMLSGADLRVHIEHHPLSRHLRLEPGSDVGVGIISSVNSAPSVSDREAV
jgi:tRNA threonylcarbamoyladenosine biosynthesis protein TsaE